MRKLKRIIALVTVAMFLLSLAAPAAMAATKEEAFGRLNALSVAIGDANGDPQYDKNFTRAEAAAIMVNLSGMKAAIEAAKGPTKFKDVPASHWASGVINLAVGSGIIKGYPDGTYKPDANVTYAEMSAMLVGVLGYTPKLQGVWPSNVIGKAAQLGLLDGLTVTDYNAAAVRSNVFLAADNALDVKPLKETKDGYEEDTKTLMESKLSVTKKDDGIVTNVPVVSGVKNKVTIDYTQEGAVTVASGHPTSETLTVADGVDANAVLGLKVETWLKDDKIFFFNVKTSSSDIIIDKLDGNLTDSDSSGAISANDTIHLDSADKDYTLNTTPHVYKNFVSTTALGDALSGYEAKVILNNGKVEYLILSTYTTKMVEKVNTTDEKLTFEVAGSLTLKDKVNTIVKGGKAITLADIKPGNVVDYIGDSNFNYIVVSDGTVEGKLEAAATDGKKVTLSGKEVRTNDNVYISTDNGDTYGSTVYDDGFDYTTHFGKNIKGFLNKDGKIAFMIASEGDASNYIPVLVKDIFRTTGQAKNTTYIYVAKFDGTETDYVVTSDSKVNGSKVVKSNLENEATTRSCSIQNSAGDVIERGEIVKVSLTADGKIDNIKEFDTTNEVRNAKGTPTTGFSTNKTSDTITLGGVAYKVDANTKLLKVKAYKDADGHATGDSGAPGNTLVDLQVALGGVHGLTYIDDVEALTWAATENLGPQPGKVGLIVSNGIVKYAVLFTTTTPTASSFKYGMLINTQDTADGVKWNMKVDGADFGKIFDSGNVTNPAKGKMVKFKLNSSDEIESTDYVAPLTASSAVYFEVYAVDKSNKRIEVKGFKDNSGAVVAGTRFWVDVNDDTKYFDAEDTASIKVIDLDSLNSGDIITLFDAFDKDGDDQGAGTFDSNELIYDFIVRTDS